MSVQATGVCSLKSAERNLAMGEIIVRTSNHGCLAPLGCVDVPSSNWYNVFVQERVVEWLVAGRFELTGSIQEG